MIDNIFTNNLTSDKCSKGILLWDISDHFPIFYCMPDLNNAMSQNNKMKKRSFTEDNLKKFTDDLSTKNIEQIKEIPNTEVAFDTFNSVFAECFEKAFPLVEKKQGYKTKKPWLTEGLKMAINNKNQLYRKYRVYPTEENYQRYKKHKSCLNKILRCQEREFIRDRFELYKSDLGKTWDTIKDIINKKRQFKKLQTKFKINGEYTTDNTKIANTFINFFTGIGHELDKKIPVTKTDPISLIKRKYQVNLFLEPTDSEEIVKLITKLKDCAVGHDNIPSKVLKRAQSIIADPLTHIVNLSLEQGVCPDAIKVAIIVPLFKSGDQELFNNYRPVSLLLTV